MQLMESSGSTSYLGQFWRSRANLWLALATLGLGFASGEALGLVIGGALYVLGLIYLPDTAWFKKQVDDQAGADLQAEERAQREQSGRQRAQLLAALSTARKTRYDQLLAVCRDVTAATATAPGDDVALSQETRLGKLEELQWTFLRLLSIEQSLDVYLETERREQLPQLLTEAEREVETLAAEVGAGGALPALETRRKLLQSRRERLDALRQRLERVNQARDNLELARSEQERLVEQVKLIRADALANKNAEALTARIDLSIEHLAETNKWLTELAEFKDLTGLPPSLPMPEPAKPARSQRKAEPPLLNS